MIYNKLNFNVLDSEFQGKSFRKELKKEVENIKHIFKDKIKHSDVDLNNLIGELSGYEMIETDIYCGGYCDLTNSVIAVNKGLNSQESIIPTIMHEIGHTIQSNVGIFDLTGNLISDEIKIEQQCELLGYVLYRELFGVNDADAFDGYFEASSIDFLLDWYGGYRENDIT